MANQGPETRARVLDAVISASGQAGRHATASLPQPSSNLGSQLEVVTTRRAAKPLHEEAPTGVHHPPQTPIPNGAERPSFALTPSTSSRSRPQGRRRPPAPGYRTALGRAWQQDAAPVPVAVAGLARDPRRALGFKRVHLASLQELQAIQFLLQLGWAQALFILMY